MDLDQYAKIKDEIDTKLNYAMEVVARSSKLLCRCGGAHPILPTNAEYIVFGHADSPELKSAVEYLENVLSLNAKGVDVDTIPDECRTFDIAFLPVILEVRTGRLFVNNPTTSRKGFDMWRGA